LSAKHRTLGLDEVLPIAVLFVTARASTSASSSLTQNPGETSG
jgi:hypothetical protein